jgi:chaperonin cofactor prefoldin
VESEEYLRKKILQLEKENKVLREELKVLRESIIKPLLTDEPYELGY